MTAQIPTVETSLDESRRRIQNIGNLLCSSAPHLGVTPGAVNALRNTRDRLSREIAEYERLVAQVEYRARITAEDAAAGVEAASDRSMR